jgi:hypothetical protein
VTKIFITLPLVPGLLAIFGQGMVQHEKDYLEQKFSQLYTEYKQ